MKEKENDPDTLQVLDELNEEWVKKWKKATGRAKSKTNCLTTSFVNQQAKTISPTQPKGRR